MLQPKFVAPIRHPMSYTPVIRKIFNGWKNPQKFPTHRPHGVGRGGKQQGEGISRRVEIASDDERESGPRRLAHAASSLGGAERLRRRSTVLLRPEGAGGTRRPATVKLPRPTEAR